MTDLILEIEQRTGYSYTEDECNTDSVSEAAEVSPTGGDDHQEVEDDNFSVAGSKEFSRRLDLKDLCDDHVDARLFLFQSSLGLFSDVRGPKPKSEQVEVSPCPAIKTETIAETPKETPKPEAPVKKKKSALKSCLSFKVERGTCSTDGDFTADLSLTSGRWKRSVDLSSGSTVNTFHCNPEDDVQADDMSGSVQADDRNDDAQADVRSGVYFSEVTVRTFACCLGDNPSTRSGVPVTIYGRPLSTTKVDINNYEKFVCRNRRRGNELLLSPQERSKMLMEGGYSLEEIVKLVVETEHGREERLESMAKEQRWVKIRSKLSLVKPSSSSFFDLKHGADVKSYGRTMNEKIDSSQSPTKGLFSNLRKLKRNRSDKMPKCITVPQAA